MVWTIRMECSLREPRRMYNLNRIHTIVNIVDDTRRLFEQRNLWSRACISTWYGCSQRCKSHRGWTGVLWSEIIRIRSSWLDRCCLACVGSWVEKLGNRRKGIMRCIKWDESRSGPIRKAKVGVQRWVSISLRFVQYKFLIHFWFFVELGTKSLRCWNEFINRSIYLLFNIVVLVKCCRVDCEAIGFIMSEFLLAIFH